MRHEKDKQKKLWVYNESTGSVTKRNLIFRLNAVESWYENPMTYEGHDPFYVDESKEALVKRTRSSLQREVADLLAQVARLHKRLRKLSKVQSTGD